SRVRCAPPGQSAVHQSRSAKRRWSSLEATLVGADLRTCGLCPCVRLRRQHEALTGRGYGVSLGLFGGAFDPPHNGHVALVRAAREASGPDLVVAVVAADPGHKRVETPAGVRLELTRAAFPADEVVLDDHARTVDMLRAHPEWRDATFLIGADELAGFRNWKEPHAVLPLVTLRVATRPGHAVDLVDPARIEPFELVEPASSRSVRARLERGEDASDVIPEAVWGMIERDGLYGRSSYTRTA